MGKVRKWQGNEMKKVLIVTYYFTKNELIAAIRPGGLAKFLPEFGWQVVVLTAKSELKPNAKFNVIETSCDDLSAKWKRRFHLNPNETVKDQLGFRTLKNRMTMFDRLLALWKEIFASPDSYKDWQKHVIKETQDLFSKERFDAMISVSSPLTSHLVAKKLKERYGIPWVADMLDLWTQSPYYDPYIPIRKMIDRRMEAKTLASADAVTSVTQPFVEKLKELHTGQDIRYIPFGFDPDQMNPGVTLSEKFTVVHTGYLYNGKRDPKIFFLALSELIHEGKIDSRDIRIEFYGKREGWLENEIKKYDLQGMVTINGLVSREESINVQRIAQMLLLLTWDDPRDSMVCPGKLYDYLAAGRPIISIGRSGSVVSDIINKTQAGIHAFDLNEIKKEIERAYSEFKSTGRVSYKGVTSEIEKFNHREVAREFARQLDSILTRLEKN
jgi:hypothetical protein